jgi:hypothetical protein
LSLTLVNNPITVESGITNNIFAGFLPIEFGFKREDAQITNVGLGIGTDIRISVGIDLTSILEIGDSIYLNAIGITGYEYDETGTITDITTTTIDLDIRFIEVASSGYINYKKNYSVEAQIIDPDNTDILLIPFSIIQDGDIQGNITIDLSIINDKNDITFNYVSNENQDMRIKCKFQYREVYEGSNNPFIINPDEIIVYYATTQGQTETILNSLDDPKIYKGYPFIGTFMHSDINNQEVAIDFKFDELNINQGTITSNNDIATLNANKFGLLFINLYKDFSYDNDTKYVRLISQYTSSYPQYNPDQYNNLQYNTT